MLVNLLQSQTNLIPVGEPPTAAVLRASQVTGVTSLMYQMFAVRFQAQQQVEVYDMDTFTLQQIIAVPDLGKSHELESFATNNCFHVPNSITNCLHTVILSGSLGAWPAVPNSQSTGVVVNHANREMVTS